MLCGTNGAVAAMDRAYMSLRARKPQPKTTSDQSSPFRRWTTSNGASSSYRHRDQRTANPPVSMAEASKEPTNGNTGGVTHWSFGLNHLLADPVGIAAFTHFLSKEYASENIRFWWSCERFSCCIDPDKRCSLAGDIFNRHLSANATEPVNIDAAAVQNTERGLDIYPVPSTVFSQAQQHVYNVMKFDSYPRFLKSDVHADFARADLSGKILPYPVRGPDGLLLKIPPRRDTLSPRSETAAAIPQDSSSKLKKSASTVCDRRRSASSLLSWRSRRASRDQAQPSTSSHDEEPSILSTPMTASQIALEAALDVVKSNETPGCSLCRVVLPDGATSVVEVDSDVTVKRMVDRLLHRRNLLCNAYDVIVKDGQGECRVIDISNSSMSLGGREAVVERRIVVRLEVGSRCVAVRCGAARRLRHVLRPVLARYCGDQARAVCRDGVLIHPDTSMVELDGARLQVVELTEGGEFVKETSREEDADSLSDLALRIQDDKDDQSTNSMTRSEVSSIGSGGAGSSLASGRVRAALRPGPPLHHHPPDFLENLRETQRQRLQNKSDPAPARTPPPLPPKPPQRQAPPTVV